MWKPTSLLAIAGAAILGLTIVTVSATADARDHRRGWHGWYDHHPHRSYRHHRHHRPQVHHRRHGRPHVIVHHHRPVVVRPRPRTVIVKHPPRRHYYRHYHRHHHIEPLAWFAFGALSYALIDRMTSPQQVAIAQAHTRATTAPIGEEIVWSNGGAHGTIVPLREGTSTAGRYCREFYREVVIGGRVEQAYGTACMQPDGSWELVSSR